MEKLVDTKTNFHLGVYPKSAGDFGGAFISGIYRTPTEAKRLAEQMMADIKRHVDDVGAIRIVWEED